MKYKKLLFFLVFSFSFYLHAQVKINEVLSSNSSFFPDEEGEYNDWIELYNPTVSSVSLSGFYISDDTTDITKWMFPDVTLGPDSFLVLFASDKGTITLTKHWETIINWGDEWKYFVGNSAPPANWKSVSFNDDSWAEGSSGFGFGDDDDSTIIPNTISVFLRKNFIINNLDEITEILFHIDYDDGFVAYINGVEIARSNISGANPSYSQTASTATEAFLYNGGVPEKYIINNWKSFLVPGENVLTVQVHNISNTSSDLTAIPFLTLGLNHIPENPKGPAEVLNIKTAELHTNFKINTDGETLILSDPQGNMVDKFQTGQLTVDISRGRYPDGSDNFYFFDVPTPGEKNSANYSLFFEEPPLFSMPAGFYDSEIDLVLSTDNLLSKIFYTTDGSEPDTNSYEYNSPIEITGTSVIRARVFGEHSIPSKIITKTYFINESITLPVISLSTAPENLWDENTGIYVLGPNAEPNIPNYGANFWQDWEKPIHMEFFEQSSDTGFSIDAGVKIFGGWSRAHPQKSLSIHARSIYGFGEINYKIFPDLDIEKFESIVLRNSGNDWNYSYIRDALMTGLAGEAGLDVQAYRPAVIFLNGEYWGIQNIREKINEHYIASHYDLEAESVIILENQNGVVNGDNEKYNLLLNFLGNNSLSIQANYDYVANQIDVANYTDYLIFQIFYDNKDWPGNNIKFWNTYQPGYKWRWLMYDTDFGFGLYDFSNVGYNTLEFALEPNGPEWPNPSWSTLLFRKLIENNGFKINFINRFNDLLNTILKSEYITSKIEKMADLIQPEIQRHSTRWGNSYQGWLYEISGITDFAENRSYYMNIYFKEKFNLTDPVTIEIRGDSTKGIVKINSLRIKNFPWTGSYFGNNPVTLTALPIPGYKFSRWEQIGSTEPQIEIIPHDIKIITAVFEQDTSGSIVINEINYNSSDEFNSEDWVELYNNSDSDKDISGYILKDEDDSHEFVIPQNKILHHGEYLVIVRDTSLFLSVYPDCKNYVGNMNFGLNGNSDMIRLFDSNLFIIDSLTYYDRSPWPEDPDGGGKSLSLIDPDLDNSIAQNWKASVSSGTPGKINDVTSGLKEDLIAPKEFYLSQNYPNPFNPSTIISYGLPKAGNVSLKIYDILGREIKVLVNEFQDADFYSVTFNADGLASGVYFYRLKIDNHFNQIKKMILLH